MRLKGKKDLVSQKKKANLKKENKGKKKKK